MDQSSIDLQIRETLNIIDIIKSKVCYIQIVEITHNINKEENEVICQLTLNRGMSDYEIGFNWLGFIDGYSQEMPKILLVDIHNAIIANDLSGIIKRERENIGS